MSDQITSLEDLAAVAEGTSAVVEIAAPREPVRDDLGRSYATGKRKDAVARVWIKPGSGKVTVNGKDQDAYFARPVLQLILRQPMQVAGVEGEFDVVATVKGGGLRRWADSKRSARSKPRKVSNASRCARARSAGGRSSRNPAATQSDSIRCCPST